MYNFSTPLPGLSVRHTPCSVVALHGRTCAGPQDTSTKHTLSRGSTFRIQHVSVGLGTGFCAAKALVEKGAHVVVLNRSSDRADSALQSLAEACADNGRVTSVPCDLLSFDSVRDAGAAVMATLEAEGVGLDGLVCNAGPLT